MTIPSHPWKQLLQRQAEALAEIAKPHRWTEASAVRLEETVVLGCYAIQRLINSFLLSDARMHQAVPLTACPRERRDPLALGDESIETLYNLKAGRKVAHDLSFVCHQVTHNSIFVPSFDAEKRLTGVYLTSDHQRKVALYGLAIDALRSLFADVAGE